MPKLEKRLTTSVASSLPPPPPPSLAAGETRQRTAQEFYWCKETPGFGVRVTSQGSRSWVFERRVDGLTKRRTLGKVTGRAAISADEAKKLAVTMSADLQRGDDPLKIKREQAKQVRKDVTLAQAVQEYVEGKRRAKDGKELKARTKAEYLQLVAGSVPSKRRGFIGQPKAAGDLYTLAHKRLSKITGDEIRELYTQLQKRSQRRASLAMQVLRAVLNWHGTPVPDNPFSKSVAGRDRIVLPPTTGNPNPIPPERLGAFWNAACAAGPKGIGGTADAAACIRFVLLMGSRGGESAGDDFVDGILVRDFDVKGARIMLHDTKNRTDHPLYLSRQALAIVEGFAKGKKPSDRLFPVRNVRKTLHAICAAAEISPRGLHAVRKTFASVADELVSGYTLKRMINHTVPGDVTGVHYVGKSEGQLRKGWQTVADFIEEEAAKHAGESVRDLI